MLVKVENEKHLVRDEYSKSIINTDTNGYLRAKELANKAKTELQRKLSLENTINTLEDRMTSLESKIEKILSIITNGS